MTTPAVMPVLDSWEPASPRLTWYGEDGERIELSGRVLTNWVTKTANLLSLECDVDVGSTVRLDLPPHWRLLVWALGSWAVGAEVDLEEPGGAGGDDVGVVITAHPERWQGGVAEQLVAVPLPALARSWPGDLPAGAIDGGAEVMGQPDAPAFAVVPGAPSPRERGPRLLVTADSPAALLETAWAVWAADGSLVIATPRDDAQLDAIAVQEGAERADR